MIIIGKILLCLKMDKGEKIMKMLPEAVEYTDKSNQRITKSAGSVPVIWDYPSISTSILNS